jgi:hypothetical protein
MGHVYLGQDDALDLAVALKFIAAANPKLYARERFLVEARAIARLQQPNVVGMARDLHLSEAWLHRHMTDAG